MSTSSYSSLLEEILSLYLYDVHNPASVVNTSHSICIFTIIDFRQNDIAYLFYRILIEEVDVYHKGNYIKIIYPHKISKVWSTIF